MKISELASTLKLENWKSYCEKHAIQRKRLLSRQDGAATSGDLNMKFDVSDVTVEYTHIRSLCNAVLDSNLEPDDAYFIANLLILSGFDFDRESTEDAIYLLSTPAKNVLGSDVAIEALSILSSKVGSD